jgi:hypothetical protein
MIKAARATLAPALMLAAAAVCLPGWLQAMEIWKFDKMAVADQGEYVGLLVGGAEKVLKDAGRPEDAAKVEKLFSTTLPGDQHTLGMVEFERNLARARVADAEGVVKNPNALRIEVEDAMAVTLKKNGIELPDGFYTVGKDFKPKHPPRKK